MNSVKEIRGGARDEMNAATMSSRFCVNDKCRPEFGCGKVSEGEPDKDNFS